MNNMTLEQFAQKVKEKLESEVSGFQIEVQNVLKDNDTKFVGLVLQKDGDMITPIIYLNQWYDEFCKGLHTLPSVTAAVWECYQKAKKDFPVEETELVKLHTPDSLLEKVCVKLVGAKGNRNYLKGKPCLPFLDLAAVFYIPIHADTDTDMSITLTDKLVKDLNVSTEELFEIALENTKQRFPLEIESVGELLVNMMGIEVPHAEDCDLYVATIKGKQKGACVLLYDNWLQAFAKEKQAERVWILPSSTHEVLLLPEQNTSYHAEALREMVMEVNSTMLEPTEILSDNVYCYEQKTGKIQIMTEQIDNVQ